MILQLFALAFVLGITALLTLHGLFSGVIMLMCCIVSSVVALGFFEPLNDFAAEYVHPSYAAPGILVVSFVLTLTILRVVADNLIRGNVRLPRALDLAGGGLCGFFSAQICVGILMMGVLMLPLGGRAMMYSAIEENEIDKDRHGRPEYKRVKLWTRPDAFTASLVGTLSGGSLQAETAFADVYPDFPQWIAWTGNTVQVHTYTAPTRDENDGFKALKVAKWWDESGSLTARYRTRDPKRTIDGEYQDQPYEPETGYRLIGMMLELGEETMDRGEEGRQAMHRFRPTMLRVVGKIGKRPQHYYAQIIGNADEKSGGPRIANMQNNFATKAQEGPTTTIDAYFEVDDDFTPAFVEYRRFARAALNAEPGSDAGAGGDQASTNTGGGGNSGGGNSGGGSQSRGGLMRFVDVVDTANSGDMDRLPFTLNRTSAASSGENAEFEGRLFKSGRIFGDRANLRGAGTMGVQKMKIPDGYRICQIRYSPKKALTLAGRVFRTVSRTLNQYQAVDSDGVGHNLSGYYAIVKRGNRERFEIFFTGGPDSIESNSYNYMLNFKDINPRELTDRDDAVLGLIFLVPKGVTITGIKTQSQPAVTGLNIKMND